MTKKSNGYYCCFLFFLIIVSTIDNAIAWLLGQFSNQSNSTECNTYLVRYHVNEILIAMYLSGQTTWSPRAYRISRSENVRIPTSRLAIQSDTR
jgi:hypothetical protein